LQGKNRLSAAKEGAYARRKKGGGRDELETIPCGGEIGSKL